MHFNMFIMYLFAVEIEVIKNPRPTCVEKNYSSLVLAKTILEIDEKTFLLQAVRMTADGRGNIYVYDNLQCKIFKFNKNNEFVKAFGEKGKGPGALSSGPNLVTIYYGKDDRLYAYSSIKGEIMSFTADGKHIKNYNLKPWRICRPMVDSKRHVYFPSAQDGMIDVVDGEMNVKTTLLSDKEYHRCLFIEPNFYFSRTEIFPNFFNTNVNFLSDSKIVIYNRNTSTIYLLDKNHKLVKKANLWPQKALESYRSRLAAFQVEEDFENSWVSLFHLPFIDEDNKNILYLQTITDEFKVLLYAFNLDGHLVKVLKFEEDGFVRFQLKINNLFYGTGSEGEIKIYKEVRK